MHHFFRHALNPKSRHVCLGLVLKPLTLGQLFFLREIESPILSGVSREFGDVLIAVLVCSRSHTAARKLFNRFWWLKIFARYWGWRCRKLNLENEALKFRSYLRSEQEMPPIATPPASQKRSLGAPWEWTLFVMLTGRFQKSEAEALNTPVIIANCLWTVDGDSEGRIKLATGSNSVSSIIHGIWDRMRARKGVKA